MVLRSVSESKAKKAAAGPGQPLRLEATTDCTKDKGIGFDHIVSVMEVINSTGKAPKGLYNAVEDRLSFHFTLQADIIEAGEPEQSEKKMTLHAKTGVVESKLKPGMTKAQRAAAERGEEPPAPKKQASVPKSPASTEPENPASGIDAVESSSKKKKELEKKRKALEQQEQTDRERIQTAAMASLATTINESAKAKQIALQRQKDRERRAELARAQPVHELQAQLRTHQQNAIQARAAVTKLQQEKSAIDKDIAKQVQIVAHRRREIEAAAERLAAAKAAIEAAETENCELENQREALLNKFEAAQEEEQHATRLKDLLAATTPPTTGHSSAAINVELFWLESSAPQAPVQPSFTPAPTFSPLVSSAPHAPHASHASHGSHASSLHSPIPFASGFNSVISGPMQGSSGMHTSPPVMSSHFHQTPYGNFAPHPSAQNPPFNVSMHHQLHHSHLHMHHPPGGNHHLNGPIMNSPLSSLNSYPQPQAQPPYWS